MGTPLYQKRCGQYGGYALSPADNFKRSKSWKSLHRGGRGRGRRGTNRELRGRSCEKPRAQDRRGVIFDADDDGAEDDDVDLEL